MIDLIKAIHAPARFKRRYCASGAILYVFTKRIDTMHALTFWKRAARQPEPDDDGTRSTIAAQQSRRRALLALSLGGTVVAATAAAVPLIARQVWGGTKDDDLFEPLLQAHLLAQCAAAVRIG